MIGSDHQYPKGGLDFLKHHNQVIIACEYGRGCRNVLRLMTSTVTCNLSRSLYCLNQKSSPVTMADLFFLLYSGLFINASRFWTKASWLIRLDVVLLTTSVSTLSNLSSSRIISSAILHFLVRVLSDIFMLLQMSGIDSPPLLLNTLRLTSRYRSLAAPGILERRLLLLPPAVGIRGGSSKDQGRSSSRYQRRSSSRYQGGGSSCYGNRYYIPKVRGCWSSCILYRSQDRHW